MGRAARKSDVAASVLTMQICLCMPGGAAVDDDMIVMKKRLLLVGAFELGELIQYSIGRPATE